MKSIKQQKGASLFFWIVILAFISLASMVLVKLAPIYYENYTFNHIIEDISQQNDISKMTNNQLLVQIEKNLQINAIETIKREHIRVKTLSDGKKEIQLKYENKAHLINNLSLAVDFDQSLII